MSDSGNCGTTSCFDQGWLSLHFNIWVDWPLLMELHERWKGLLTQAFKLLPEDVNLLSVALCSVQQGSAGTAFPKTTLCSSYLSLVFLDTTSTSNDTLLLSSLTTSG